MAVVAIPRPQLEFILQSYDDVVPVSFLSQWLEERSAPLEPVETLLMKDHEETEESYNVLISKLLQYKGIPSLPQMKHAAHKQWYVDQVARKLCKNYYKFTYLFNVTNHKMWPIGIPP